MAGTFSGDIFLKEIFIYFVFVVAVARLVAPRGSSILFYSDGVHLFANSTGQKSFNGIFRCAALPSRANSVCCHETKVEFNFFF